MFIRAQFSAQSFRDLIKFRTVSGDRPCAKVFWELSPGVYAALKKISFAGVTQVSLGSKTPVPYPSTGTPAFVFQQSRVVLKVEYNLVGSLSIVGIPVDTNVKVTADLALDLRIENGKDMLYFEVIAATADNAEFQQKLDLTKIVSDALGTGGFELGMIGQINKLSSQLDNLLSVRHADLGFNPSTNMLEMRFEMTSGGAPAPDVFGAWSEFYNNAFDTLRPGAPWAMFYDQRIGTTIIKHSITKGLDASGKFSRDEEVQTYWDAPNSNFHMSVNGEVIDACICINPFDKIDLDVRIWGDVTFSTPSNKLRMDVRFDWKVTDVAEAACCFFSALVFFPLVGIDMVTSTKNLEWWEYLIGLVLYPYPVLLLIAGLLKFSPAKDSDMQPQGQVQQDPNDDKHYWVEFDLPRMLDKTSCGGANMSLGIDSLSTRGDGLVMAGSFVADAIVDPAIDVKVVQPFKYVPPYYGCSGSYDKAMGFEAVVTLSRTAGNYDFHTCDAALVTPNNDIKLYSKVDISEAGCPKGAVVTIRVPYWAYDFQRLYVVISTSQGAFLVILEPGAAVSEEQRTQDDLVARLERINNCYVKSHPFWDIKWLVDPEPFSEVLRIRRWWVIEGMVSENTQNVVILSEAGERLLAVDTQRDKYFKAFLSHDGDGIRVAQELSQEWSDDAQDTGDMHAVQILAAVDEQIELSEAALSLDAFTYFGEEPSRQRRLVVYGERTARAYDFAATGNAALAAELHIADSRWVGRRGTTLRARREDGALLSYDMTAGWARWELRGTDLEAAAEYEREIADATGSFEHLLARRPATVNLGRVANVRGSFRNLETDGFVISAALSPKLAAGNLSYADTESATIVRLSPERFAMLGEGGRNVQLLKVLAAQD